VTFELKNPSIINIEKLNKFPKASGVIEGNNKVSVIFGSISKTIEQKFNDN
jgi:phosphotransferase system IIB component